VGGDTTLGPLNICITVFGEIPQGQALLRSGAAVGDDLYVSGTLGDARLALEVFRGGLTVPAWVFESARLRMEQPTPRVALGQALRGIATAAIDISDGLLGDLRHVLRQSGVGVRIDTGVAAGLMACTRARAGTPGFALDAERQLEYVLSGGDDYELAFTAPPAQREAVEAAAARSATPVTRIGTIETKPGIRLVDAQGQPLARHYTAFDHFA
jgi:thiamine-monophosphate kinase